MLNQLLAGALTQALEEKFDELKDQYPDDAKQLYTALLTELFVNLDPFNLSSADVEVLAAEMLKLHDLQEGFNALLAVVHTLVSSKAEGVEFTIDKELLKSGLEIMVEMKRRSKN